MCMAIVDSFRKERVRNRVRSEKLGVLGQYRIILSADTASEVRQMLSQKRR